MMSKVYYLSLVSVLFVWKAIGRKMSLSSFHVVNIYFTMVVLKYGLRKITPVPYVSIT
jgi:hypothetical protein